MNKFTNFLTALISGTSCTENEVREGFSAIKSAGIACMYSNTQADGKFTCGRSTEYCWGKKSLRSVGYILTPSYRIAVDCDSKDAGEMSLFSIGRMDDREVFQIVAGGRYEVAIVDVFLALAGVVIADSEIYSQEAIPAIIERIHAPKVEAVTQQVVVLEQQDVAVEVVDAEELRAARKAAKQAEKAAAIAARKGR